MNDLPGQHVRHAVGIASEAGFALPVAVVIILLLVAAYCSAAEITIFSLTQTHLDHVPASRRRRLARLKRILLDPGPPLLVLTSLRVVAQIGVALVMMTIAARVWPDDMIRATVAAAAGAFLSIVLFGEFLPKAATVDSSLRFAARLSAPLLFAGRHLGMLPRLFFALAERVFTRGAGHPDFVSDFLARAQLRGLIERGEVEGLLDERERELIDDILDFRFSTVDQIMVPRPQMEALPDDLTHEQMLAACRRTRHSRIPVYHDTTDTIVAILHVKEVLANPDTPYTTFFREPLFVPEKCDLTDLLAEFQKRRMHLAVVVDEYGGVSGAVSLADLLKEITSAFASGEASSAIRPIGPDRWIVRGDCEISECNEVLDAEIPERNSRTIGGFLTEQLGRFPEPQEVVEFDRFRFRVLRVQAHRVLLVRVTRVGDVAEEAPESTTEARP